MNTISQPAPNQTSAGTTSTQGTAKDLRVVLGRHRFTCLSPHLVRLEFAPDGVFEERRSMVAFAAPEPVEFASAKNEGGWDVIDTGFLEIRARSGKAAGLAFDRNNLELRWSDGKLMQIWVPGDRDYQNLGGTLRSLDRYGKESCALDGVSVAGMDSPDAGGTAWPAWFQCEVDPLYNDLHADPPANLNSGHWLEEVRAEANDGRYMQRTWNWYKEVRKFCPGVLSRSGYYFLNDSEAAVLDEDEFPIERERPGYQDWYFFAYGSDYLQALRDFRLLSGPAPIPTHRTFGIIFSRWPAFSEKEVREITERFAAEGCCLSTLVMDMEWHKEGWGHWDFNPELIPDPARFFALCKEYGLEVVFNDHPLDVRSDDSHFDEYVKMAGSEVEIRERPYAEKSLPMARVDITNKDQNRAFVETCSQTVLEHGLDYWWNDGSRGQLAGTAGQLIANKTFFETSERDGLRGMLLARYGGLGSHRYGVFFTGDTLSDWPTLRLQCEFNIRAAGVGLSHVSHDIGGFCLGAHEVRKRFDGVEVIDLERYVRWLQFGVMNPILRFHSAPGSGSRLPFDYDGEAGGACRKWLRIRHMLLPYLYSAAHEFHETGIPITRGMFLQDPDNADAYRFDQYFLGPDLLVAPMFDSGNYRKLFLPEGEWVEFGKATRIAGGREVTKAVPLDDFPVFVRVGAILPLRDPDSDLHAGHIDSLILELVPGAAGETILYEDDGRSTNYLDGEFCKTRLTWDGSTLSGCVMEGRPLGRTRKILVRIRSKDPVTDVWLDGRDLDVKMASADCAEIELTDLLCDKPWVLNLQV